MSNSKEGEAAADPAAAAAGAAAAAPAAAAPGSEFPDLDMFSAYNKIQLPIYCKSQLDEKQLLGIAYNAKNFVDKWKKASGDEASKFYDLKSLDADQFAAFYKDVNADAKAASDEVPAADAEKEKDSLVKVINFMDPKLTKAGWNQYWIYMCAKGIQPEEKQYKHENGKSEQEFDKYLAKKLGLKMAEAGNNVSPTFAGRRMKKSKKFHRAK